MNITKYLLVKRILKRKWRQRKYKKRIRVLIFEYFKLLLLSCRRRTNRSVWAHSRTDAAWIRLRDEAPEEEFKAAFRMSRESFNKLVGLLREDLEHIPNFISTRVPVPPDKQVALTLYKLASCAEYRVVGNVFGVHKSTVCRYVYRVVKCINRRLMRRLIRMPDEDQCRRSARAFQDMCGLPQIIAAVDGSHIPILPPEEGRKDFMNRKNYASIILQGTVDHSMKFIDVSVKFPGSCHDAFAFKNSSLFLRHDELIPGSNFQLNGVNIPYIVIGDPAYPLLPWLMKDFYGLNLPEEKDLFNKFLNKARVTIEIAFGRLKGRWRTLLKRSDILYTFMPQVVTACCTLHNFVEDENESFQVDWTPAHNEFEVYPQPPTNQPHERDSLDGTIIRNTLVNYLNSLT